jgi:hypothetical protein
MQWNTVIFHVYGLRRKRKNKNGFCHLKREAHASLFLFNETMIMGGKAEPESYSRIDPDCSDSGTSGSWIKSCEPKKFVP